MQNSVKNRISKEEPINASNKAIWYFLILRERELDPKARLFLIHWSLRRSGIIESNDLKSMGTLLDISLAKMQWTIRWASKNNIVENFNIDQKKKRGRPKSSHSLTDNFKNRIRGTQTRQLYQSIILRLLGVAQNEQHLYSLEINPTSELALNHDSRFVLALLFLRANVAGTVYGVNLEQMSLLTGLSRRNVLKHLQHLQQANFIRFCIPDMQTGFFKDPAGIYSLNLSHPVFGREAITQHFITIPPQPLCQKENVPEAKQFLDACNAFKNYKDYKFDLKKTWLINLRYKTLNAIYEYELERIEAYLAIQLKNPLIWLIFPKKCSDGFIDYLQAKLEFFATLWLELGVIQLGCIDSRLWWDEECSVFAKIKKEFNDNKQQCNQETIHTIGRIFALLSLAIAFNYSLRKSYFFNYRIMGKKGWAVTRLYPNNESARNHLVLLYINHSVKSQTSEGVCSVKYKIMSANASSYLITADNTLEAHNFYVEKMPFTMEEAPPDQQYNYGVLNTLPR